MEVHSNDKFAHMTVLPLVYNKWGAMDAYRVMKTVKDWCFIHFPKGDCGLSFSDNGCQVIVRAMFVHEHQLIAFKQRFAPSEE